jgi:hypothetical protein
LQTAPARAGEELKHEAIENRRFTMIEDRQQGRGPRQISNEKQHAAGEFEDARDAEQRDEAQTVEYGDMREAEQRGRSMLQEQQGRHEAQSPEQMRGEARGDNREVYGMASSSRNT